MVSTILICFLSTFINISGYYTNTKLTENTFEITNANAYIFENKSNPPSLLFYLDNQYILGGYTNLKEIQDEQKLPTYKDLGKTRNIQSITNTQNTVIKNSKQTTYRWKYKLENGYVYRRLYNACKKHLGIRLDVSLKFITKITTVFVFLFNKDNLNIRMPEKKDPDK